MLYPDQDFVRLSVNDRGRDFFIGDLHGCVPLLDALMDAVKFDADRDRLFSVGDLIDHGPDSFGAIKRLQASPHFHAVLGNHEAMALGARGFMRALEHGDRIWHHNGGHWGDTLQPEQWGLVETVLQAMPLAMEIPLSDGRRVGMVHAEVSNVFGWDAVGGLSKQNLVSDDDLHRNEATALIWARTQAYAAQGLTTRKQELLNASLLDRLIKILAPIQGIDLIIAGHTVMHDYRPHLVENRLTIDTGAFWPEGALTMADPVNGWYWQATWLKDAPNRWTPSKRVVRGRLPPVVRLADASALKQRSSKESR